MVKLPTRESLGAMPEARSGRPIARVDTTAAGEGMAAMGQSLTKLGVSLAKRSEEDEERLAAYEAEKRIIQFTKDQTRRLDDEQRNIAPGGAGFTDGFARSYDESARQFFRGAQQEGLSPRALQRLDIGLLRAGEALQTRANVYENTERQRQGEFELEEVLSTVRGNVRADPNLLSNERERGRVLIEGAPHISPANRYAIQRRFNRLIEEEALQAMRERVRTPEDLRRFNEWAAAHARVPGGSTRRGPTPDSFQPAQPGRSTNGVYQAPGLNIEAGIDDTAPYMSRPRNERDIRRIIVHGDVQTDVDRLVRYGRQVDRQRGFDPGYHFYIAPDGRIVQGAPLNRVANHALNENADTIGIVIAGADGGRMPTPQQEQAARALISSLGQTYGLKPENVMGHGELQPGRRDVREGGTIAADIRASGFGTPAAAPAGGTQPTRVAAAPGAPLPLSQRSLTAMAGLGQPGRGSPQAAAGGSEDRSADAGYAPDAAVTGTAPPQPMRVGSTGWLEQVLDEEDRGGGTVARTNLPNVATGRLRSEARGAAAQVRQTRTEILNTIKTWEKGAMDGISPSAAEVAQTREMVDAFNDGSEEGLQVAEYFHSIVGYPDGRQGLIAKVDSLRRLPPAELEKVIRAERQRQRASGTTEADRRLLTHMESLLGNAKTQIKQDPNGWMADVGHSPAPEQLDFNDDATMQARATLARRNGQTLNQQPRFFSPNELESVRDTIRRGDDEMISLLGSIGRNFGMPGINEVLQRSEDGRFRDPELAAVAGIAINAGRTGGVGMQLARDLADEVRLRNTDASYNATAERFKPREAELKLAQEFIGRTFSSTPGIESAATAATNLLYLRWARTNAVTTFDDKKYREIFMGVIGQNNGEPGTSNAQNTYGGIYFQSGRSGNPVAVPSNIRNDNNLRGLPLALEVLQMDDLRAVQSDMDAGRGVGPVGATGRELTMRDLRGGRLVGIGGGRYVIDTANNPAAPTWAMAPPGGPSVAAAGGSGNDNRYVLDLNRLEPVLRERVPEIYRDYQLSMSDRFRPRGFGTQGPTGAIGPDHPDYPKGQFAPQVNPGRAITQPEWIEFQRQFRERHPSQHERDRIMSSQSRYWKELQQFIDRLPPVVQNGPT